MRLDHQGHVIRPGCTKTAIRGPVARGLNHLDFMGVGFPMFNCQGSDYLGVYHQGPDCQG